MRWPVRLCILAAAKCQQQTHHCCFCGTKCLWTHPVRALDQCKFVENPRCTLSSPTADACAAKSTDSYKCTFKGGTSPTCIGYLVGRELTISSTGPVQVQVTKASILCPANQQSSEACALAAVACTETKGGPSTCTLVVPAGMAADPSTVTITTEQTTNTVATIQNTDQTSDTCAQCAVVTEDHLLGRWPCRAKTATGAASGEPLYVAGWLPANVLTRISSNADWFKTAMLEIKEQYQVAMATEPAPAAGTVFRSTAFTSSLKPESVPQSDLWSIIGVAQTAIFDDQRCTSAGGLVRPIASSPVLNGGGTPVSQTNTPVPDAVGTAADVQERNAMVASHQVGTVHTKLFQAAERPTDNIGAPEIDDACCLCEVRGPDVCHRYPMHRHCQA